MFWCPWRESDPRPLPYQGSALPLSHMGKRTIVLATIRETVERETGIEPASSAWKAGVLPLNYSRKILAYQAQLVPSTLTISGGGDWIRTSVGVSQQIYSLPPLATRAPLRRIQEYSRIFGVRKDFCRREHMSHQRWQLSEKQRSPARRTSGRRSMSGRRQAGLAEPRRAAPGEDCLPHQRARWMNQQARSCPP